MLKKLNRNTAAKPQTRTVKVLQFGEGNFLRAFVDWMIDILNEKTDFNGAVQMVQPIAQGMGTMVNAQDGLYHVILNGIQLGKPVREIRMITAVTGVVNPYEDYQAFLKTAENPHLKFIISNTTEAGITFDAKDTTPLVLCSSFPGKLTALLHHRYTFYKGATDTALTIMPCELIEKNGEALRNAILQYIALWKLDDGFKNWIEKHTLFCNTLVDRIVPGFPKDTIGEIQSEIGYEDNLVVTAEPFHLWVIEPKLPEGTSDETLRKAFPVERAGLQVKFVSDLTPYRTRKVRILNGAHTTMVPVAYLRGLRTVREAVDDAFTGNFIRRAVEDEIIPTLDLSKEELQQFSRDVMERFQNTFIRHELMSIALNSISKYQVRVLPSVLEYVRRKGKPPELLLYSLAALIRFYKGEWQGQTIALNDTPAILAFFKKVWASEDLSQVVRQVLSNKEFWNLDLTTLDGVASEVEKHLNSISAMEKQSV
jgi:tagaturonate reductase